jgi:hypothetical protein
MMSGCLGRRLAEDPFHAVQGRANPPARVLVFGPVEVGRGLVCLDRKRHFNPASTIEDQGPHSCDESLLHETGERSLRAALEAAQVNRVVHGLSLSNAAGDCRAVREKTGRRSR